MYKAKNCKVTQEQAQYIYDGLELLIEHIRNKNPYNRNIQQMDKLVELSERFAQYVYGEE